MPFLNCPFKVLADTPSLKNRKDIFLRASKIELMTNLPLAGNPNGYWRSIVNRQKYFFELAASLGFDPLVPENWKRATKAHIIMNQVFKYY